MATSRSAYSLPKFGDDWLHGLRGFYIILSLKHSTPDVPMFWKSGDLGYTEYLVNCGIYSEVQVKGQIWRYNDGANTVAIPLTATALRAIGFSITIDFSTIEQFANRESDATKGVLGKGK